MHKILIIEDNQDCSFLLTEIINSTLKNSSISHATTVISAVLEIVTTDFDLIITDYHFPVAGFPAILPFIKEGQFPFILQSADPEYVKMYDNKLQIGAVNKGSDFVVNMMSLLNNHFKI